LGGYILLSFVFYNHSNKVNHKQIKPNQPKGGIIWLKSNSKNISAKTIPNQKIIIKN